MTTNAMKKAAGAINTNGPHDHTNDLDFATGKRPGKAIATLIAELAIAGYCVHPLADGGYFVTRGDMSARHCADFTELQSFARQKGGAHD